jgi:hypothetical protein
VATLDGVLVLRFRNGKKRLFREERHEQPVRFAHSMLNEHDGRRKFGRQIPEEEPHGVEPAQRGADDDHVDAGRALSGRVPGARAHCVLL